MGRGGNAVASAFLDKLMADCGVGPHGEPPADAVLAEALEVFCDRTSSGHLVPRRLMAGEDPGYLPPRQGSNRADYPDENYVVETKTRSENNWAIGYNSESIQQLLDRTCARIDSLGNPCVIWLFHSVGGGYGSGGGSRFLNLCHQSFNVGVPVISIALLHNAGGSESALEPYNAVLAFKYLCDHPHQVWLIDNRAALDAAARRRPNPTLADLNVIIAEALCTLASPLVWPDAHGTRFSVRDLHAALWTPRFQLDRPWLDPDQTSPSRTEIFVSLSVNQQADSEAQGGADLAARLLDGGDARWVRVFGIFAGRSEASGGFTQAIPESRARIVIQPTAVRAQAIGAGMSTSIVNALLTFQKGYKQMFRRQAFLSGYLGAGLYERDFVEAETCLDDLITELRFEISRRQPSEDSGENPNEDSGEEQK
jgi:hypothetical protein